MRTSKSIGEREIWFEIGCLFWFESVFWALLFDPVGLVAGGRLDKYFVVPIGCKKDLTISLVSVMP